MRPTLLLLALCAGFAAPAAAQGVTVERDGAEITITRPDGTTERFTVDENTPLRVRSKNGPLMVEREEGVGGAPQIGRRFEVERGGDAPRAFAFRMRPGETPFHVEEFMEDFEFDGDSTMERLVRSHHVPGGVEMHFDGVDLMHLPGLPGFGTRGVDPETRRAIAEGERESRTLARRLRRAEGDERDALAEQLRQSLGRTFDLKQQARRERIEHLQAEGDRLRTDLAELEAEVAERDAARREIIENRRQELLGESDGLDW